MPEQVSGAGGGSPKSSDLGAYIAGEVAGAERDYQNVRSKALSLVSTSGGLVALISGLLAIASGASKSSVPIDSRWTIAAALGAFVISAIYALLINRPQSVSSSDEDALLKFVKEDWDAADWDQSIAERQVTYLKSLRIDNAMTANLLTNSIRFQIAGVLLIAMSVVLIFISGK